MGRTILYPDGSVLTSDAFTVPELGLVIQPLTCAMLQIPDPVNTSQVRMSWPTAGAPAQDVADDVCYLRLVLKDDPYDKIRDVYELPGAGTLNDEQWNYTRVWTIHFLSYGPNAFDNLRAVRSALYQNYFTQQLSLEQLFPMSEFTEVVRAPELIDGQWWERADLLVEFYEFVTETITRPTIATAEVIVEGVEGVIADFTVSGG
jgi:hypothetical protein